MRSKPGEACLWRRRWLEGGTLRWPFPAASIVVAARPARSRTTSSSPRTCPTEKKSSPSRPPEGERKILEKMINLKIKTFWYLLLFLKGSFYDRVYNRVVIMVIFLAIKYKKEAFVNLQTETVEPDTSIWIPSSRSRRRIPSSGLCNHQNLTLKNLLISNIYCKI